LNSVLIHVADQDNQGLSSLEGQRQ
jgi:hypothetical protein